MKKQPQKIQSMQLPVQFIKQGKLFVAYSPALDLSTVGATEAKARKMFVEAVNIFFEELIEKGTLGDVLEGLGWMKVKQSWNPPKMTQTPLKVHIPAFV